MTQPSTHIRFRGRSFPVLALEPDAPIAGWIERLDACLEHSPSFFSRKAIVVDVSKLGLDRDSVAELVDLLSGRSVRIMGLTGVDPSWACDDLPPILTNGHSIATSDALGEGGEPIATLTPNERAAFEAIAQTLGGGEPAASASSVDPEPERNIAPLVVETPVRSGQSIFHPEGDVIVIGSVSSGADVIAGGSVHVYGTVRGRIMAGAYGESRARIFCRRLEAELLAVGGFYMTADEIRDDVRGRAVHARLEDETIKITKLD
ncbi:septum site-determining protein MinC [Methylosinus sp. H3A]|uniref:septum site-determining protein MinC n=1 Tax=Methylosinus sp. H3A TaxID=2785786 RepID=UPI0018C27EF7|nr:septum site-determining protein MinC [Methylosinus sp. H3A]MBG0808334.1 septum site-determining protein MinC [Methylosinus sp. H3A]